MIPSRFPDAPAQIKALEVEARGYPIPWFVPIIDGEPEFRAVDPATIRKADRDGLCWICGQRLAGGLKSFVIGPMCAINRIAPEPPSHLVCARFAALSCPFLSRPMAKRRPMEAGEYQAPAGIMIPRNPGVTLVWSTSTYRSTREPGGGLLFHIGSPQRLEWFAEGRHATQDEVLASIESGLPILQKVAAEGGPEEIEALAKATDRAMRLIPE